MLGGPVRLASAGGWLGSAHGQIGVASGAVAADSAATDTSAAGEAPPGVPEVADTTVSSTSPARTVRPPLPRFERPRWVMLRSAVVPGWGQLHNGSWIKAIAVGVGETGLIARLIDDRRTLDRLGRGADAALFAFEHAANAADSAQFNAEYNALVIQHNTRLDAATSRQWLLGGVIAYALLDAYIDAHFRNFKIEFETDPALPGGKPPADGSRIGLRVSF